MQRLKSAVFDTGKTVLQEHLVLAADSLSFTGEFVGLSAKGLAQQRKQTSVPSPFMKACFSVSPPLTLSLFSVFMNKKSKLCNYIESMFLWRNMLQNPSDCFIKAAKMGSTDNLQGSLDALSWGNVPSMGTGGKFDILYSRKVIILHSYLLITCRGAQNRKTEVNRP